MFEKGRIVQIVLLICLPIVLAKEEPTPKPKDSSTSPAAKDSDTAGGHQAYSYAYPMSVYGHDPVAHGPMFYTKYTAPAVKVKPVVHHTPISYYHPHQEHAYGHASHGLGYGHAHAEVPVHHEHVPVHHIPVHKKIIHQHHQHEKVIHRHHEHQHVLHEHHLHKVHLHNHHLKNEHIHNNHIHKQHVHIPIHHVHEKHVQKVTEEHVPKVTAGETHAHVHKQTEELIKAKPIYLNHGAVAAHAHGGVAPALAHEGVQYAGVVPAHGGVQYAAVAPVHGGVQYGVVPFASVGSNGLVYMHGHGIPVGYGHGGQVVAHAGYATH